MSSSFLSPLRLLTVLAVATFAAAGCKDDPITPPQPQPTIDSTLHAPLRFEAQADSTDSTAVRLSWERNPLDSGSIIYRVRWCPDSSVGTLVDSLSTVSTGGVVDSLTTGVRYRFELYTVRNGLRSATVATDTATPSRKKTIPPPPSGTPPVPPSRAAIVSLNQNSVRIRWEAANDTGTITYAVKYRSEGGILDSGTISDINGTNVTISALLSGRAYAFSVYSVRSEVFSATSATVSGAPANRYSTGIRMYEKSSSQGSGLIVDPSKGGPENINITVPSTDVQLAMFVDDVNKKMLIGPLYGLEEYRNVDGFDRNVYISDSIYLIPGLNEWYDNQPISDRISEGGNLSHFPLPFQMSPQSQNMLMFYLRTGVADNYHYARVLLKKDASGKILQGTAPNRYVELEISYQTAPNVPYAKIPAGAATPRGYLPATRTR